MPLEPVLKQTFWNLSDRYLAAIAPTRLVQAPAAERLQDRHFVILTPSDVGNLGDEAMVTSVVSQLSSRASCARITLITHLPGDMESYRDFETDIVCLEGFFSKTPSLEVCDRLGDLFQTATDFILLGADILDGRYSRTRSFRRLFLARQAERAGLNVHVLGFSFSDKAIAPITDYMRRECVGFSYCCRDPLSAERIGKVVGKSHENGADLAFLLPIPDAPLTEACERADARISEWRRAGKKIIAINANPLGLISAFPGIDLKETAAKISAGLDLIAEKTGCVFLGLTHDNRPVIRTLD
ncbi:polysaccharide pyruvyl transferase family protein [Alloyangia pacifica]|uniref:polysaccharide pyruvyl transferase family protein n=1 Tax=Alloyangia pacifica TaxID=311180 RepID=UPI0031DE7E2F